MTAEGYNTKKQAGGLKRLAEEDGWHTEGLRKRKGGQRVLYIG
jgi:hypothetical protein